MPRRRQSEITEISAPPCVSPMYANMTGVFSSEDTVVMDFGLVAPSYIRPYDREDRHVARICVSWDTADIFLKLLKDAISEHKKELKSSKT